MPCPVGRRCRLSCESQDPVDVGVGAFADTVCITVIGSCRSLADNDVGDEGALALVPVLPQCRALSMLEFVPRVRSATCNRHFVPCSPQPALLPCARSLNSNSRMSAATKDALKTAAPLFAELWLDDE